MLCGGKGVLQYVSLADRLHGVPGEWNLISCPECRLLWLSPRPILEDVQQAYAQYYTHVGDKQARALDRAKDLVGDAVLAARFGYRDRIAGSLAAPMKLVVSAVGPLKDWVGRRVMWLEAVEGGRLLDVGCGDGALLERMAALGWEAVGVEPDPQAAAVARAREGVEVRTGDLIRARFPDSWFHAVTMRHVIEHLHSPLGVLQECRRVLRTGGRLAITTPNILSTGHRVFREAWLHLDPPRHIQLFSPESLAACVMRAGFQVELLRTNAAGSARVVWNASRLIRDQGCLPGASLHGRIGLRSRVWGWVFEAVEHLSISARHELGEEILLVARK